MIISCFEIIIHITLVQHEITCIFHSFFFYPALSPSGDTDFEQQTRTHNRGSITIIIFNKI